VASEFDESDFVDGDLQAASPAYAGDAAAAFGRPPSRQELEAKVGETQQRIQELKRVQEELERERAGLEEARRRRSEFHVGKEEMMQHLTRGIGLMEEAEFGARRDAEQMAKTLGELRDSMVKVQGLNDQTWTQENYSVELTRALTTLENARMEWNAAQLKWPALTGTDATEPGTAPAAPGPMRWIDLCFWSLCRLGVALTWPLAVAVLAALITFLVLLFRR